MAEVNYHWPDRDDAELIGTRQDRLDGMVKSTGVAKYTNDINLDRMLFARALGCPHAHCRVKAVDTAAALKVPGVVHVHLLRAPKQTGDDPVEIECQGELIAAVAAETEAAAAEGVSQLKVEYELLDVFADDEDLEAAEAAGRTRPRGVQVDLEAEPGDDEDEEEFEEREIQRLLRESTHVVEGYYGVDVITHCCLEPHGTTVQWQGGRLTAWLSTQNVSGTDDGFAGALGITADEVDVNCEYIGGGFGSKFAPDYWGIAAAEISKATGRPVKFMLTRDQELKVGGNRPSGYLKVRLGADENGVVRVWDSHHWGTNGYGGNVVSTGVIPYVYAPQNSRRRATGIGCNADNARAWRAPNHPQGCAMSQTAYDDLAAKMGVDSYDIFLRNLANISNPDRRELYQAEMEIAAELVGWKANWHPHGKGPKSGSVVEGLGMGIHTWGGTANTSSCMLRIHPDGGVQSFCGTQDLGTGTRTVCAMVLAETLGLPLDAVKVHIGSSKYPNSGASGGSTTVGAVSESHRRAAQDALARLFDLVAPKLQVAADKLEAVEGRIQVQDDPGKSLAWQEACRLIGLKPLEVTSNFQRGTPSPLSSEGVGGVQMAHVAVDAATGVIKLKKFVAVQDMGLIINRKTAESQVYGAVIMAIAYSLFEQRLLDDKGAFVNAELSDYRLPRLGDIGEIVVNLYEPESERQRGVIGLGEPPVISGGAAISNAVCNALGVRVPVLPLTPKRVLDAIKSAQV
jgi:xanthine dehydrogenase YagR molybdenum-binding subunit